MKIEKSIVIKGHSSGCFMEGKEVPWSGIIKREVYGNFKANPNTKVGRHHLWYIISCNDPKCEGEKAVHSSVLAEV